MSITPPRSYLRYTRTVDRGLLHSLCAEQVPHVQPGKTVELATRVLSELFLAQPPAGRSPAIRCRLPMITVDGVGISHRKVFIDSQPTVRITPRIRLLADDRHTRITTTPVVDINTIPADQDTYDSRAAQIAAIARLIDDILDAALDSLNAAAQFYALAFTEPEPETTFRPARRLDDNCTIIGSNDGHSAVLDNQGLTRDGLIHLVTEHGVLELEPDTEVEILDDYGIPPEDPDMCQHMTYRATLTTPAEYCDNEALPGSDYCAAHDSGMR